MTGEQNPNFTGDANQQFISGLAPAIYMVLLGGPNATHTRRDWVDSLFRKTFMLFSAYFSVDSLLTVRLGLFRGPTALASRLDKVIRNHHTR